jgi:hypothetical protein
VPALVLATPHLLATAIAACLEHTGDFTVVVPRLDDDDWRPVESYPVVITSMPVPKDCGDLIIELPASFTAPVLVTIGDITAPITVPLEDPFAPLIDLARRYVRRDLASPFTI